MEISLKSTKWANQVHKKLQEIYLTRKRIKVKKIIKTKQIKMV
jgi:hypothetical protein